MPYDLAFLVCDLGGRRNICDTALILLHIAFSFTQNKNLFESISLLTN
jgi:hypothetical protein